ncbi:MAG: hypothetical protein BGN84_12790 [Afipia sp. 62-7]|nr:MAG: hypothetical protein BGN84_12790 [Afipia sp. 62-7]
MSRLTWQPMIGREASAFSFCQDQFVLRGQTQAIGLVAVDDQDFACRGKKIAAVDAIVGQRDRTLN